MCFFVNSHIEKFGFECGIQILFSFREFFISVRIFNSQNRQPYVWRKIYVGGNEKNRLQSNTIFWFSMIGLYSAYKCKKNLISNPLPVNCTRNLLFNSNSKTIIERRGNLWMSHSPKDKIYEMKCIIIKTIHREFNSPNEQLLRGLDISSNA